MGNIDSENVQLSLDDASDSDLPVVHTRDVCRPTPLPVPSFDDQLTDFESNIGILDEVSIQDVFNFIGQYVEGIQVVPVPAKPDSVTRFMLEAPVDALKCYCLTTSLCVIGCVTKCNQELVDQGNRRQAKDYMQMTTLDILRVNMAVH